MVDMRVFICSIIVWFIVEEAAMLASCCWRWCLAICSAAWVVDAGGEKEASSSMDGEEVMRLMNLSMMEAAFTSWWYPRVSVVVMGWLCLMAFWAMRKCILKLG